MNKAERVRINAPQSFDPLNSYHGKVGIGIKSTNKIITTVYFTEGILRSMTIPNKNVVKI